jgi:hypothetical protein
LKTLQAQLLKEPPVVFDGPSPFLVVIAEIERIAARPPTALPPVGSGD